MAAQWLEQVRITGCGALPVAAERELMAASRVGPDTQNGVVSAARLRAINRAYERTSSAFPHLFKD